MDNAIIHKSATFNKFVNDNHLKVIYNVPYCPQFNSIEYVFGSLKKYIIKNLPSTEDELFKTVSSFVKEVNKVGLRAPGF